MSPGKGACHRGVIGLVGFTRGHVVCSIHAHMSKALVLASFVTWLSLSACGGGGTADPGPDAMVPCALPTTEADAGNVSALAAQRCNVPGSMGAKHWWRLLGSMSSDAMDIVQLELWPNLGAFA